MADNNQESDAPSPDDMQAYENMLASQAEVPISPPEEVSTVEETIESNKKLEDFLTKEELEEELDEPVKPIDVDPEVTNIDVVPEAANIENKEEPEIKPEAEEQANDSSDVSAAVEEVSTEELIEPPSEEFEHVEPDENIDTPEVDDGAIKKDHAKEALEKEQKRDEEMKIFNESDDQEPQQQVQEVAIGSYVVTNLFGGAGRAVGALVGGVVSGFNDAFGKNKPPGPTIEESIGSGDKLNDVLYKDRCYEDEMLSLEQTVQKQNELFDRLGETEFASLIIDEKLDNNDPRVQVASNSFEVRALFKDLEMATNNIDKQLEFLSEQEPESQHIDKIKQVMDQWEQNNRTLLERIKENEKAAGLLNSMNSLLSGIKGMFGKSQSQSQSPSI